MIYWSKVSISRLRQVFRNVIECQSQLIIIMVDIFHLPWHEIWNLDFFVLEFPRLERSPSVIHSFIQYQYLWLLFASFLFHEMVMNFCSETRFPNGISITLQLFSNDKFLLFWNNNGRGVGWSGGKEGSII